MAGRADFVTGVGATGPRLVAQLNAGDLDLTGATVRLIYRREDAISVVDKPGILLSISNQLVAYDPDEEDTARVARLRFQFRCTLETGQIVFWPDNVGIWEIVTV